jgi:phosphoserine phosphatase RsbX
MAAWTIAHRTRQKDGELANGDAVVLREEGGRLLVAIVDGLGHGKLAAAAAGKATEFLEVWPLSETLLAGMQGLHDALRGSRGAAASVCLLSADGELVCCGVGNVEIRYQAPRQPGHEPAAKLPILLSPGVLGARVANFRICRGEVAAGARLVLFSDGISFRAPLDTLRHLGPEELCEELMLRYRKPGDDATVVACDIRGTTP